MLVHALCEPREGILGCRLRLGFGKIEQGFRRFGIDHQGRITRQKHHGIGPLRAAFTITGSRAVAHHQKLAAEHVTERVFAPAEAADHAAEVRHDALRPRRWMVETFEVGRRGENRQVAHFVAHEAARGGSGVRDPALRTQETGDAHALGGRAEHELAGVQDEGPVVVGLDELGQIRQVLLHVDHGSGVAPEHQEPVVEANVDRARLHHGGVERVDDDAAGLDLGTDGPVTEDHVRTVVGALLPSRRRVDVGGTGALTRTLQWALAGRPSGQVDELRGCSSMVEHQLPKLNTRVRFSSPALLRNPCYGRGSAVFGAEYRLDPIRDVAHADPVQ